MEIRRKDDKIKPVVEYTGMSLRHEHVENDSLPKINIFFSPGALQRAEQISYGVEEEGLPRRGVESDEPFMDALEDTAKKGLGVAIGVDEEKAQIFCRQFKKSAPFMSYDLTESMAAGDDAANADAAGGAVRDRLRIAGKNAARILKHKPFIIDEQ